MSEIIYLNKDVFCKLKKYGILIYNVYSFEKKFNGNKSTANLLSKINGKKTIEDICREYNDENRGNQGYDEKFACNTIEYLLSRGFLTKDSKVGKAIDLECKIPELDMVNIRITNRCNFHCIHCFPESDINSNTEMTTGELYNLIDKLVEYKVIHVTFTGGEPFLIKDFLDLVKYSNSKGMVVSICTNASLINTKEIEELSKCALGSIKISMDGATAEVHDLYRGKGKFDKLIPKIKQIVAAKLPVCINTVISKVNFHQYKEILELARELNVHEFAYDSIRKMGRAKEDWDNLGLDYNESLEFLNYYNSKHPKYGDVYMGSYFFPLMISELFNEENIKKCCNTCLNTVAILSNGDVTPCWRIYETMELTAGNIFENNFEDIWRDSPLLNKLRGLNLSDIKKCNKCELNYFCDASCRAFALPIHKDWNGEPDEGKCKLRKSLYLKHNNEGC
jgi:radical SAM protein with 4Fe4S-binding SPASM domain